MEVWRGRDVSDFFYALWSHEEYLKEKANPKKDQPDGEATSRARVHRNRNAPR